MYVGVQVKCRYYCHILMKLEFSRHILENIEMENFMKIPQWEPSYSMRTDRRAGRHDEANNRFPQFYKRAPINIMEIIGSGICVIRLLHGG